MALSEEQIAKEKELMSGLLPINIAAFLIPPLWGPVHGIWAAILFYPAWVFADNIFYGAVKAPSLMSISFALIIGVVIIAATLVFARLAQPIGIRRALAKGKTKEDYIRAQRIWVMVSIPIAIGIIILATYYNLNLRTW